MRGIHSVPEDALRPSSQDLDHWEHFKLVTKNPFLTEGILVRKDNSKALLLLYQNDPNKTQNTHYQGWEGWFSRRPRGELLGLMEDSGIRYEVLTFDIKGKKFSEQELDKLKTFEI